MYKIIAVLMLMVFLTGCAVEPQAVQLPASFWQQHNIPVKVATTPPPKARLYQQGSEGILDIAINAAVTNKFNRYLKSYRSNGLIVTAQKFINRLQQHGINAVYVGQAKITNKQLNKKDFRFLLQQFGPVRLLLLSINQIGASRYYYGFIPLGKPSAISYVEGRLVDLASQHVLWRDIEKSSIVASANWDQPPNYPSFTRLLRNVSFTSERQLLIQFFSSQPKIVEDNGDN